MTPTNPIREFLLLMDVPPVVANLWLLGILLLLVAFVVMLVAAAHHERFPDNDLSLEDWTRGIDREDTFTPQSAPNGHRVPLRMLVVTTDGLLPGRLLQAAPREGVSTEVSDETSVEQGAGTAETTRVSLARRRWAVVPAVLAALELLAVVGRPVGLQPLPKLMRSELLAADHWSDEPTLDLMTRATTSTPVEQFYEGTADDDAGPPVVCGWRVPSETADVSGRALEARFAGPAPADRVNPSAFAAMAEGCIDITAERHSILNTDAAKGSDAVITMGCDETCPIHTGRRYEDWELEAPAGKAVDSVRPIRDEVKVRVLGAPTPKTAA